VGGVILVWSIKFEKVIEASNQDGEQTSRNHLISRWLVIAIVATVVIAIVVIIVIGIDR
jgi:uncharacterized membrane protein